MQWIIAPGLVNRQCLWRRRKGAPASRFGALLPLGLLLIALVASPGARADGKLPKANVTPRGWPHQIHPITGKPYSAREIKRLKLLRKRFPKNLLLPKANDTTTTRSVAWQVEQQDERARRMTAGTATEAEIHAYYDLQKLLVQSRLELVQFVLSEPQWSDEVRSRYQKVLATSLDQVAEIETRRARSIEIAANRPDPGEEPEPFASIAPKTRSVMRGEPASFTASADPDVQSILWALPTGESPETESVSFSTVGLEPGTYEVVLQARKGGNLAQTSLASAHLRVTPGPKPAVDLAVEAVEVVPLPDQPQQPTGQFQVATAVRNAGAEPAVGASLSLVVDGALVQLIDGLSLKPGERRSLRSEPIAVDEANGKLLSVSIAPEDPGTEENDIDNALIRTIEIDPDPGDIEILDPTEPFVPLPSGVPIPPPAALISGAVLGTQPLPIDLGPIPGFADLHLHQMAELGYDGKLLWGSHDGPSEELALPQCFGNNHAFCYLPSPVAELLHGAEAGSHAGLLSPIPIPCGPPLWITGDLLRYTRGWHQNATDKAFKEWPIWRTITHQQAYRQWLEQAHQDGLNLIVMSAINSSLACDLIPSVTATGHSFLGEHPLDEVVPEGLTPEQLAIDEEVRTEFAFCNERKNVRRQLIAAWTFADKYPWYEIALTPGHAAQIIQEGKLAVVLSIEANKYIDADSVEDAQAQFDYWVDGLGVRSFQPVHQLNSQLGGPSYFNTLLNIAQGAVNAVSLVTEDLGTFWQAPAQELLGALNGMVRDASGENTQVMTTMGLQLLLDAMDRGILIDLSHMDRVGSNQAYNVAVAQNYYPLFISHARYQDLLTTNPYDDHLARPWEGIQEIKHLKGMIGLRTGRDRVRWYTAGFVNNNCPGSSRDFAQSYLYGSLGYGIPQAFGSDLNGFIQQMRPRYHEPGHPKYDSDAWACGEGYQLGGGAQSIRANFQALQGDRATQGTNTSFDLTGFGHIGQIGAVVADLQQLGVDTTELEHSAERFVEMWLSAYTGIGRGPGDTCLNRQGVLLGPATGGPLTPGCP